MKGVFSRAVPVTMLVLLATVGHWQYRHTPAPGTLGETILPDIFAPSAMMALGQGFHQTNVHASPALQDFFFGSAESLDTTSLALPLETQPLDSFSLNHRYLLWSLGMLWRVTGIRWDALEYIELAFYLAAGLALYGLFRLVCPKLPAAALVVLFMVSPGVLGYLGHIRDFSRAPFLFGAMWMWGRLICGPPRRWRLVLWGIAMGALAGVGIGFRHDVLIMLPASVGVLALGASGRFRGDWHWRGLSIAATIAVFLLAGWPILQAGRAYGPASYHHTVMGLATLCDDNLGLRPASYERLLQCSDEYATLAADAHYRRGAHAGEPPLREYLAPREAEAKRALFFDVVRYFSADMLGRGYAALLSTLRESCKHGLFPWFIPLPVLLFVAGLLYLAACRPRYAWAMLTLSLYFAGSVSLQFVPRHCFYLGFIPLWSLALLASALWRMIPPLVKRTNLAPSSSDEAADSRRTGYARQKARRMALFCLAALVAISAPLFLLRMAQRHSLEELRSRFAAADLTPLLVEKIPEEGGIFFRVTSDGDRARLLEDQGWDCIVVEFAEDKVPLRIDLFYTHHFTTRMCPAYTLGAGENLGPMPGPVRCFIPVFRDFISQNAANRLRFSGIGVPADLADGVLRVCRVRDTAALPLPINLVLPGNPSAFRDYQALPLWHSLSLSPRMPVLSWGSLYRRADAIASALQSENTAEARTLLETEIARDPRNPIPLFVYGGLLEKTGAREEAIAAYCRAYANDPEYIEPRKALDSILADDRVQVWQSLAESAGGASAFCSLGNAYRAQGEWNLALDAYRHAQTLDPNSLEALKAFAETLAQAGQTAESVEAYLVALSRFPSDIGLHLGLGKARMERGDLEGAENSATEALALVSRLDIWKNADGLIPAYLDIADIYQAAAASSDTDTGWGRVENGQRVFDYLLSTGQNIVSLGDRFANGMVKQAEFQARLRPDTWPVAPYGFALSAAPQNFEIAKEVNRAIEARFPAEERARVWDELASRAQHNAFAWYHDGLAHAAIGELDQALASYRRTLDIFPFVDVHRAWVACACQYQKAAKSSLTNNDPNRAKMELDRALQVLDELLDRNAPPEMLSETYARAQLEQASLTAQLTPNISPLKPYELAIKAAPQNFQIASEVDAALKSRMEPPQRLQAWKDIIGNTNNACFAFFFEGIAFFESAAYGEAADCFQRSLDCYPEGMYSVGFLGWCKLELGDCAAARELLERASAALPEAVEFNAPLERARACP